MTAPVPGYSKPSHPELARLFDKHVQQGDQIRYADNTQLVVWKRNEIGCGGWVMLILLGIITAFIVPIVLLILGALSPRGQLTTYTVKPGGGIKKKRRAAK